MPHEINSLLFICLRDVFLPLEHTCQTQGPRAQYSTPQHSFFFFFNSGEVERHVGSKSKLLREGRGEQKNKQTTLLMLFVGDLKTLNLLIRPVCLLRVNVTIHRHTAQSAEGSRRAGKEPCKLHTERNRTCNPCGFKTVLLNISQSALAEAFKLQPSPDGGCHNRRGHLWTNGSCFKLSHAIPAILSAEAAHGGSSTAVWRWHKVLSNFSKLSWCLPDPSSEIGCAERKTNTKIQLFLNFFFRYFHEHIGSLAWCKDIYGFPRASSYHPERKKQLGWSNTKVCLMSRINTVCYKLESSCGWNIDFSQMHISAAPTSYYTPILIASHK